jgi:hypothetical protein
LWLRENSTVYVDYAVEIDSGALFVELQKMPSLGEVPRRAVERRVTATNAGSFSFRIREDGMYQLSIKPKEISRWSVGSPELRYKVIWGLENPEKSRKPLKLETG